MAASRKKFPKMPPDHGHDHGINTNITIPARSDALSFSTDRCS